MRIFVSMDHAEVVDPKGITKDVAGVGHWGTGDVEMMMDSLDQLEDIMAIIEQAFQKQESE